MTSEKRIVKGVGDMKESGWLDMGGVGQIKTQVRRG